MSEEKKEDYGKTLNSLGPTGQKAFQQLATAVAKSEIPIAQTNGMLKEFGTTMKNTLRWQASSMLLHGTVNAIQSAWNYAQKLDRSLTDIQIEDAYTLILVYLHFKAFLDVNPDLEMSPKNIGINLDTFEFGINILYILYSFKL